MTHMTTLSIGSKNHPAFMMRPAFTDCDYTHGVTRTEVQVDGCGSVAVVIRVGSAAAWVTVTLTRSVSASTWRHPNAKTMRKMVDNALTGTGLKRTGHRTPTSTGWSWVYDLTTIDTCVHESCGLGDCSWLQHGGIVDGEQVCNQHLNHSCRADHTEPDYDDYTGPDDRINEVDEFGCTSWVD